MIAVVTPSEMGEIDRAAPEPVEVLIGRAGAAVAREAIDLLGGTYGRRVVVVAGQGNNGNDGREAARRLLQRGVGVTVVEAADLVDRDSSLDACDLVIDAAYGTGFRGDWGPPPVPAGAVVLAVDIPSGVDGLTGEAGPGVWQADRTVTFAALKPGLVLGAGRALAGEVTIADIGLDVSSARAHVVTDDDVSRWLPTRGTGAHKWQHAVWVVAGSPGMAGAAALVCGGAQRTGAGYVRLSTPGGLREVAATAPEEVVQVDLPRKGWAAELDDDLERFGAVVLGNGLGTGKGMTSQIRSAFLHIRDVGVPVVLDADGLTALAATFAFDGAPADGHQPDDRREVNSESSGVGASGTAGPAVLTPHDGEYQRLTGRPPGPDRLAAARDLSARTGAITLLKGSTTVVSDPAGNVLISTTGDARLATAGTGDVLAGVIGALCARGVEPFAAAAAGAFIHGQAGALGWSDGFVAGDLLAYLPAVLADRTCSEPEN